MKDVERPPAWKSGWSSSDCRNGMLVDTPRIRNSASARRARRTAVGKSRPRHVSLTSIESKCPEISEPAFAVAPSSRTPRRAVRDDAAGVRAEAVRRVLGRDARLQGRPVDPDRLLRDSEVGEGLA